MPNTRESLRPVVKPPQGPLRPGFDLSEQPTTFIGQRDVVIETPQGRQKLPTTAEVRAHRIAKADRAREGRQNADIPREIDPHKEEVNKMRRMITALETAIARPQKISATLEMLAKAIPRIRHQETLQDAEARQEIIPKLHAALSKIEEGYPEVRQDPNFQTVRALIDEGVSVLTTQDGYTVDGSVILPSAQSAPFRPSIHEQQTRAIPMPESPTTFIRTSAPPEPASPPPAPPAAEQTGFWQKLMKRFRGE